MPRTPRKFVVARLNTATSVMVSAGAIPPFAKFDIDQTGSDRYPWQLVLDEIGPDGARSRTLIADPAPWSAIVTAVDALYNTAYVALAMSDRRQGNS